MGVEIRVDGESEGRASGAGLVDGSEGKRGGAMITLLRPAFPEAVAESSIGCGGTSAPGSTRRMRALRGCPSCSNSRSGRASSCGPEGLPLRSATSVSGMAGMSVTVAWFRREMI